MNHTNFRDQLPLRIERVFEPWLYAQHHNRLELRTGNDPATGQRMYVAFFAVAAMQIRRVYRGLVIAEATDTGAIDRFAGIPEHLRARHMYLSVGDGEHEGFVVCGALTTRFEPFEG
jgi:hypothetical protein